MNPLSLSFEQQHTNHHQTFLRQSKRESGFLWVLFMLVCGFVLMMKQSTNHSLFLLVNQASQHFSPALLASITDLGNGIVTGSLLIIILCFKPAWILRVMLAAIICLAATHLLKNYFDASRPASLLAQLHIVGDARHSNSFPSGHTATIFLLAGTVFLSSTRQLSRILLLSLAVLVGLSRVSVGAHWPIDVALGAVIGWSSIYAASALNISLVTKQAQFLLLATLLLLLTSLSVMNNSEFPQLPIVEQLQIFYLFAAGVCLFARYVYRP
ncbi:phosphatase PAP2 family protein [Shewanella colwelliana]|uniref:phosphatase PAP2 family protein n=1 Tax=Shewanella colwelliana TaxID=23 RepID=UPI0022AF4EA6|nr:phosphatase PAP2 family protein [Shewanella colwelliana]MCZ4339842.1 phosphatase PAP2 family protein [Shewanella colwelliana]